MADYAIGDVQGCFEPLMHLLEHIKFNPQRDSLWFVGDLVNRGPQSLQVLRFIQSLPIPARISLGNHDLHCLARLFIEPSYQHADDTLDELLSAPDANELGHWLRRQALLVHDEGLNIIMCHAGIAPMWDLPMAKRLALELGQVLSGPDFRVFLTHMYGNEPDGWSPDLTGMARLRVISNYFTRMRFCNEQGHLALAHKEGIQHTPQGLYPWFSVPNRKELEGDLVFGHWAALNGVIANKNLYAIDTGCVWGRQLTALRLQDKHRFSVPG